jgi:hypothetical protein
VPAQKTHPSSTGQAITLNEIAIAIPVYNDWEAVRQLLPLIDEALESTDCRARILLIDDASTEEPGPSWPRFHRYISDISILHLRRNLGHQRAIAIGLVWVYQHWPAMDALVIMDSDGEDRPKDIPVLLRRFVEEGGKKVIFAARAKRLESAAFQLFYHAYRIVHKMLTGVSVRVGNFSVMSMETLGRVVVVSEIWNHYAAAVLRARLPNVWVPIARGSRLAGRSHMNFVSLLVHGLGGMSVWSDILGARLLAITTFAITVMGLVVTAVGGIRLFTTIHIPQWVTYATALTLIVLVQALIVSLALVFIIVSGRATGGFLPIRDTAHYIDHVEQVNPAMSESAR